MFLYASLKWSLLGFFHSGVDEADFTAENLSGIFLTNSGAHEDRAGGGDEESKRF